MNQECAKEYVKISLKQRFPSTQDPEEIVKKCLKNLLQPSHPFRPKNLTLIAAKFGLVYDLLRDEVNKSIAQGKVLYDKLTDAALFTLNNPRKEHKRRDPLLNLYRDFQIAMEVYAMESCGFSPIFLDGYEVVSACEIVATALIELKIVPNLSANRVKEIFIDIRSVRTKMEKTNSIRQAPALFALVPNLSETCPLLLFEFFLGNYLSFSVD